MVTAGNASGINDGAAVLLVVEEQRAREMGWKPRATILGATAVGVEPEVMGLGPVDAVRKLCGKLGVGGSIRSKPPLVAVGGVFVQP